MPVNIQQADNKHMEAKKQKKLGALRRAAEEHQNKAMLSSQLIFTQLWDNSSAPEAG